jgi:dTDP-4-dehydrorhamnose 3,5-epimerase
MEKLKKISTKLEGLIIIQSKAFSDERGFFLESYNRQEFSKIGIHDEFVQDNISHSAKGVIRGLHFQVKHPQGKLVRVLKGKIFDVVVDIRVGSPSYGDYLGIELSENGDEMLYVPVGFAHGFLSLEENTDVMYKVTDYYAPQYDAGIFWNDRSLNIKWPIEKFGITKVVTSLKDSKLPELRDIISPFAFKGDT